MLRPTSTTRTGVSATARRDGTDRYGDSGLKTPPRGICARPGGSSGHTCTAPEPTVAIGPTVSMPATGTIVMGTADADDAMGTTAPRSPAMSAADPVAAVHERSGERMAILLGVSAVRA
ncbi:unannotated protein [freshwater metagenome]|uniref:Unannotated protein n=1 Tax=freshwater metagenome TaxID=449393 RepID=A0A6J7P8N1_9ZZZZ